MIQLGKKIIVLLFIISLPFLNTKRVNAQASFFTRDTVFYELMRTTPLGRQNDTTLMAILVSMGNHNYGWCRSRKFARKSSSIDESFWLNELEKFKITKGKKGFEYTYEDTLTADKFLFTDTSLGSLKQRNQIGYFQVIGATDGADYEHKYYAGDTVFLMGVKKILCYHFVCFTTSFPKSEYTSGLYNIADIYIEKKSLLPLLIKSTGYSFDKDECPKCEDQIIDVRYVYPTNYANYRFNNR